jgi:ribosomal protein S12 methylthiotransferase accessory factor YcaO
VPSSHIYRVCLSPHALVLCSSGVDHKEARTAGTLEVIEELCWMPAGWVFDTVLERMAVVLHPQEPALAERLLAARTEANSGYL